MRSNTQQREFRGVARGLYNAAARMVRAARHSERRRQEIRLVRRLFRGDSAWYRALDTACKVHGLYFGSRQPAVTERRWRSEMDGAIEPETAWLVMQQGGSSTEWYAHVFVALEAADAFRRDCWEDGAYRTTLPMEMPAEALEHKDLMYSLAEQVGVAVSEVE